MIAKIKFYFKYLNKVIPANLQNLPLLLNTDIHPHNTRQSGNLSMHRYVHSFAKQCLRFDLPKTINELPSNIHDKFYTHSLQGLVRYTKTLYINNYQESCDIPNCYICAN